jgi:pimeloyl-ACP methyl ester carboxylesterase
MVLTSCDAFEHFPPTLLRPLPVLVRVPGATRALARAFALPPLLSRPGPLNLLVARPVDRELVRSWMAPVLADAAIRDDLTAFIRAVHPRQTLAAAQALGSYPGPAVVAWSRRDRIFPPADAERLVALLPEGTLRWIEGALTFSPLDQPEAVAGAVREALARVAAAL